MCQLGVIIIAVQIPNFLNLSSESVFDTEDNDVNYIMIACKIAKLQDITHLHRPIWTTKRSNNLRENKMKGMGFLGHLCAHVG